MNKNYDSNNIFAKIIRGEMPSKKVYEDANLLAFHDKAKAAPIHILIIPKNPFINFADFTANASVQEIVDFFRKVREIAEGAGLKESGYRLVMNNGSDAGEAVPHFHLHIIGGKKLSGLLPGDKEIR